MIREIQRLKQKNVDLEEEKDTLGEKNSWIQQIIESLKDNGHGIEIIDRLKRGESHQSIAKWLGEPLLIPEIAPDMSPTTERSVSQAIQQYYHDLMQEHDMRYWTSVVSEGVAVEHLVKLYLTWIHPVHMMFDENHFVTSFRDCSDEYCSSALVSVICAVSCHLLHDDRDDDDINDGVDILRNQFMQETRRRMRDLDDGEMTTVQTYAIMHLAEFGSGHGLIATSHLRLAVESLIDKQNSEHAEDLDRVATWGILTLHT